MRSGMTCRAGGHRRDRSQESQSENANFANLPRTVRIADLLDLHPQTLAESQKRSQLQEEYGYTALQSMYHTRLIDRIAF